MNPVAPVVWQGYFQVIPKERDSAFRLSVIRVGGLQLVDFQVLSLQGLTKQALAVYCKLIDSGMEAAKRSAARRAEKKKRRKATANLLTR